MKNLFKSIKSKAMAMVGSIKQAVTNFAMKLQMMRVNANLALANSRGENYVDSGVKILIAVVLGALLLGGLYALFGDVIMPTLTERIKEMFDYAG